MDLRRPPALLTNREPPELLVHDAVGPCPYLPGELARLPLRLPLRLLTQHELDARLGEGDRRQGIVLYRASCPSCHACEPIRIVIPDFAPRRRHRRVLSKGDAVLRVRLGAPVPSPRRVSLYSEHLETRGLRNPQFPPMTLAAYKSFLVDSCCQSFEARYWLGDALVGVAVVDKGADSLSAHYCYYDPRFASLSIGSYSILKLIDLCRTWGLRYLYLGLLIDRCPAMLYKASFLPHERLIGGTWTSFA